MKKPGDEPGILLCDDLQAHWLCADRRPQTSRCQTRNFIRL